MGFNSGFKGLNVHFTFSGMCKITPFAFDDALEPKCIGEYMI